MALGDSIWHFADRARPRRRLCRAGIIVSLLRGCVLLLISASAHASVLTFCDTTDRLETAQKDRVLRFAAVVRQHLDSSGERLALISRAGLGLQRFGMRYSHAGISLLDSAETPWAVRQLYVDCDDRRPRLFDQGLSAFLLGAERPDQGWVSVVWLPVHAAAPLEAAVRNNARALTFLHPRYSANAYAGSVEFQNCNQWVLEMMADAWESAAASDDPARPTADRTTTASTASPAAITDARRRAAQAWLRDRSYEPAVFDVRSGWLMMAGFFIPWIHNRDHPSADVEALRYRVTMPASIEAFVRQQWPTARRTEFCHTQHHIVVRDGWSPIAEGCVPSAGDRVVPLN